MAVGRPPQQAASEPTGCDEFREVSLAETEAQPYENSGDAALVTAQRDEHICLLPDDNSGGSSKDSSSSLGPRGVPGHGVDEGSIGDVVDGANDFGSGSKRSIGTAGADADSKVSDGGRHGASSAGASDRGDDDDGWGCWGRFVASWVFPQFVLFLGQFAFAIMHVSSHRALNHIPPFAFSSIRIAIAVPFLLVSARVQEPEFRPQLSDIPWALAMGGIGISIPQTTIFIGNKLAGAAYAAIFTPTVPVFTALISALVGMEALTRAKSAGIGLTIAGTLVLLHIERMDFYSASTVGLLVLLLNCLCFSCYLVMMQHRLRARPYPFTLFAAASVVGTTIITIEAMHDFGQIRWREVPGSAWGAVLWAALGTSFLAHSGIAFAVSRCAAVVPSIYSCLQTVLTVALSAAILGQMLSLRDLAAMAVILAGVACVIVAKLREDCVRRAEQAAEYQRVKGSEGEAAGKDPEAGPSVVELPSLRRVPSRWAVCDFNSSGHVLAKARHHSTDNLSAMDMRHTSQPRRGSKLQGGGKSRVVAAQSS
mmetsp:Transcript_7750/g.22939  ORF Transcript_7750/g.22939 Transcript_7750/m.22939 type:complete len:538 (-) Transcript_7750:1033-2646(-)|eukprot:CAMPEP_0206138370 /NCGR_PEP_ID=MMETSP1473-20131121/3268_1 /ASSEMBLY_ACC=CAM_ASM_001109 /TAXON_ID=1461547 /ORGANISM="Stichococcus sp, Strain RCC1054" /LENGTH=537 /DNA_ID=CAMNT_0053531785 /DNA_START=623 /DNA_END=2236 /DNA_ORIENTATION=+